MSAVKAEAACYKVTEVYETLGAVEGNDRLKYRPNG